MTPSPFLRFYLGMYLVYIFFLLLLLFLIGSLFFSDDGEQVLVDMEGKDHKQISQHVKKILGKSE